MPTRVHPQKNADSTAIRGLYAIADTTVIAEPELLAAVEQAILGGARVVQYRDKRGQAEQRERQAQTLAGLCAANGVTFIVNDDVALATRVQAHGVHLGREDAAIGEARRRLGADAVIGVSCYNALERALAAEAQGADYVAFGSVYPSPTKPAAVRANTELLRQAKARLRVPVVAIGGITTENAASLIAAGADAVAVISDLFARPDIQAAARGFSRLFR